MSQYILIEVFGDIHGEDAKEIYAFKHETLEKAKTALRECFEGAYWHCFEEDYVAGMEGNWRWIDESGTRAYINNGRSDYYWWILTDATKPPFHVMEVC